MFSTPRLRSLLALSFLFVALQGFAAKPDPAFFPEIPGWKKGEQKAWGPEDLYVPIDGAADLFLRYNFEEMQSVDYAVDGDTVSAEVYKHATEIDAFGIYSQGRPARDKYLELGVQAYAESDSLNLLAGRYYVEIRSTQGGEGAGPRMKALAGKLAALLNKDARFPSFFGLFPGEGRKPCSEKYLAKDVLGYAFLKQAYQVDYDQAGKASSLYVCRGNTEAEAAEMFSAYLNQTGSKASAGAAYVEVQDKYHGKVGLLLKGRHLLCLTGQFDSEAAAKQLGSFAGRLAASAN